MTDRQRLLDLLAARATEGLSAEESLELERGLREHPDVDPDALDLAAAAADLAFDDASPDREAMPETVKRAILERASAHVASAASDRLDATEPSVTPFRPRPAARPSPFDARLIGWYAAAAVLLLALWSPWSPGPETPPADRTVSQERALLVDSSGDLVQVEWATPEIAEYAQVTGDVVWSNERQAGYMRLKGLPANRSTVEQYQLWIVDPSRDEHPIDGGVFDIPVGAGEVIVPIDAKIRVNAPQAFAITLEKPGGVVVSDGPLLVVAPV